jgi:hypothetical protein
MEHERLGCHQRDADVKGMHYRKQEAQEEQYNINGARQVRAWDISSRAHSCADAAGTTDSAGAGGNGLSQSSGSVVSLCASALSRTGLVAVFAGDCDRD